MEISFPKKERKLNKHSSVDNLFVTKYAQNSININFSRNEDYLLKKHTLMNKPRELIPITNSKNLNLLHDVQNVQLLTS